MKIAQRQGGNKSARMIHHTFHHISPCQQGKVRGNNVEQATSTLQFMKQIKKGREMKTENAVYFLQSTGAMDPCLLLQPVGAVDPC